MRPPRLAGAKAPIALSTRQTLLNLRSRTASCALTSCNTVSSGSTLDVTSSRVTETVLAASLSSGSVTFNGREGGGVNTERGWGTNAGAFGQQWRVPHTREYLDDGKLAKVRARLDHGAAAVLRDGVKVVVAAKDQIHARLGLCEFNVVGLPHVRHCHNVVDAVLLSELLRAAVSGGA